MTDKQNTTRKPVKCDCGKVVAYEVDGKIYVYCKSCKRQVEVISRAKSH